MFLDQEAKISDPRGGVITSPPPPPIWQIEQESFLRPVFEKVNSRPSRFVFHEIPSLPFLRPRDSKIAADFLQKKKKCAIAFLQNGVGEWGVIQFVENYFVESLFEKVIRSKNNLLITSSKQARLD